MSKKLAIVWVVITWQTVAALSLFPLILSVGRIEAQHQEKSFAGQSCPDVKRQPLASRSIAVSDLDTDGAVVSSFHT
ncbi:hypothetical protein ACFSKU_15475 [Pontibacter silvestris]|uniref:Uncharacterized protein n=1 Tax=Pontibacter silvestris TaxID=2305183 RepID=A0ABW4X293_9BACT|nr:hypothetical protein [Pontibacter silvestris]MCC9137526.1 hypothetical protein [Pontibacter silvestris]